MDRSGLNGDNGHFACGIDFDFFPILKKKLIVTSGVVRDVLRFSPVSLNRLGTITG